MSIVNKNDLKGGNLAGPATPPPSRPGDPVPWFRAISDTNPSFAFSSLGGRYVLLSFLGSFSARRSVFEAFVRGAGRMAAFTTALVLVTADPEDRDAKVPESLQGVRYFFDFDRAIEDLFRAPSSSDPITYIIDERLRILAIISNPDLTKHVDEVYAIFDRLPPLPPAKNAEPQAPVLIVPHVFEKEFCSQLVAGYEEHGGQESGYMVERDGLTVPMVDYKHKRRSDWTIEDPTLILSCHARIQRRLVPEIRRAYQFNATRIERNTVACYSAEEGGHFARHRDNTTKGTAHRRFAVSINLNTEDHDGGNLIFPEFGLARFRPPTGGACVFSCSLLHEATPVTRGKRYVFVPFLYDEDAAAVRQRNLPYLAI